MRIDTEIRPVIVEIDGKEHNVAPKTVELLEKLRGVEDAAVKAGKMRHEMEMEQLELLLGRQAVRGLFKAGKNENVDRVDAIYYGVLEAFDASSRERREARTDAMADEFRAIAEALKPLAEMMALMRNVPGKLPAIKRPAK